jgi:uncharacterized SAM-dependent methyltransferase
MTAHHVTALQPASATPPATSDLLSDVIAGLSSDPRTLPCKYFYDERGAALFQKICELPEYYVTRTEIDILSRHHAEIASQIGPNVELIGLGTGAGTKTRILIKALEKPAAYIPVDISEKQLRKSTAFFQKFSPSWKFCLCAPITCSPSCCLHRVTSRHVTLFIFPDQPLAISSRMKRWSFCAALPMFPVEAEGC